MSKTIHKKSLLMRVVCLYLSTFFISHMVHASIISYEFSGIITQVTDDDNLLTGTSIAPITSTFTGKFSYDDAASPSPGPGSSQSYPVIAFSAVIDNNYNFKGITNDPNLFVPSVSIVNDNNIGGLSDSFSVGATDPNTAFDIDVGTFNLLQLYLTDSSATVFSSTMLPSELNLNDFNGRNIFFRGGQRGSSPGSLDTQYVITGTLASLTMVPIPASIWLLGSGFIVLLGSTMRKVRS